MTSRLRTGFRRSIRRSGPVSIFRQNKRGVLRPVKAISETINSVLKKLK